MAIRVLVVDDSVLMRAKITEMVERDGDMEVVGTAGNGLDALRKIPELKPDVVTLDVQMPKLDGLSTLKRIMEECPARVIVVTGHPTFEGEETVRALELGAVDYILKPSGSLSLDIDEIDEELRRKIRQAMQAQVSPFVMPRPAAARVSPGVAKGQEHHLVVIGASTGGPRALSFLLPQLSADLPAGVVIIQHMPAPFTASFARHLHAQLAWEVVEAVEREEIRAGRIVVARGGGHLDLVQDRGRSYAAAVPVDRVPGYFVPSISYTMKQAAELYGPRAIGVLITGMGDDGVEGLLEIRRRGGRTIAESEESAVVYGMSRVAVERGAADFVLPLDRIAGKIAQLVREG